jgi:hypothetical protein
MESSSPIFPRNGKHKKSAANILAALDRLPNEKALRIKKVVLADEKGVRGALYRAAQQAGRKIGTITDDDFLYVWNKGE